MYFYHYILLHWFLKLLAFISRMFIWKVVCVFVEMTSNIISVTNTAAGALVKDLTLRSSSDSLWTFWKLKSIESYSSLKPAAYITHNATWPTTLASALRVLMHWAANLASSCKSQAERRNRPHFFLKPRPQICRLVASTDSNDVIWGSSVVEICKTLQSEC